MKKNIFAIYGFNFIMIQPLQGGPKYETRVLKRGTGF